MVQLKTLRWGDSPCYLVGPSVVTRVLTKEGQESQNQRRRCDDRSRRERGAILSLEDGGRGHEPRNADGLCKGRQGNRFSPTASEGTQHC